MFRKVLIATDSSPSSLAVVGCGEGLHRLGARECILAQCFVIRERVAFPEQIKGHLESSLNQQKEMLEKQGLRTTIVVEPGLAGTEIPRIAAERNCSLIVVGSHGQNLTSEIVLGGTATDILHKATKPILLIRLRVDEDTGQAVCVRKERNFMRHVLYATDFSDHSERAFDYVSQFVECGALRVMLLHVQDKARLGTHLRDRLGEFNEIDRERLEMLRDRLKDMSGAQIDMAIPYGSPIDEILKRTEKGGASVVVMASHGRGFINELFLGSVSHNVARHSEAPVLLIPVQHRNTQTTEVRQ